MAADPMKSLEGQIMNAETASRSYHFAGIAEIGEWIRRGDISPVELVKSSLQRIERLNPQLNAFITVASDSALQAAESAAKEIRDGKWRGPLHGLPIGIKDFYDTAGIRTTAAFEHFRNRVPGRDAACVEKLKKAGAIIIGKTNMHTLGMGTTGLESCFGSVKNPWDARYIPGGSSSGSAVAVASGLCYATIDTDAIGSCRLPAACCGVVGFKATYGLIVLNGILAGEKPPEEEIVRMAHAGITTRSVEDTAIVLDVIAERTGRGEESFAGSLRRGRALRVGVARDCKADAEVLGAFQGSVSKIQTLGYPTIDVPVPRVDPSQGISHIGDTSFQDVDVLVLPATTTTVLRVDEADKPTALSPENTMFANYYGLPAISIPCGFDKHGLPLGLQIVAKPGDEAAVLMLAHQFEAVTDFGKSHPGL